MTALQRGLSPDPRATLKAGFLDAGQAISNMTLVASIPKPVGFFDPSNPEGLPLRLPAEGKDGDARSGTADETSRRAPFLSFANTDMAFSGDLLAVGGDGGPLVRKDADFFGSQIDHGLDGEGHAGFEFWADAAFSKIRNLGIFVKAATDAVSNKFANDAEAIFYGLGFDEVGNVADAMSGSGEFHSAAQNPLGDCEEPLGFGGDYSDGDGGGIVANPSIANDADIHFDDVAIGDGSGTADAMNDLFVYADANVAGEFFVSEKSALDSGL